MTTCSPMPLLLCVSPTAASGTCRAPASCAQLREHLGGLGDARRAERMAAADQPAPRVHHDLSPP